MRRSKEDSLKTRQAILVAARHVFARRGVSRTSMEHIARAAGVTRGAVYGHFRDKGALFQAMREHVKVPLVDVIDEALLLAPDRPLDGVQRYLLAVLEAMRDSPAARETFHILLFKCEYVGDVKVELERQAGRLGELVGKLEHAFRAASRLKQLRARTPARLAALETAAFLMGIVRLWLLDEAGTLMRPEAARLIRAHVANLRRA